MIRMCLMLFADLLRSKACRWEFGYIRKPELVHVYVPSGNNSPGRIVKWEELMEDAQLCRQLFGEALGRTFQGNLDAEDPTTQGTFTQLEKMAETAEEQEHQAWCELPFRQLAYNFARNTFGEESADTMSSADNLIPVFVQTGFAAKAQQIGKDLLEKKEKKFGKDHLNVATTLTNLGNAHGDLGDYSQTEGPARACPENRGAALRERTSRSSSDFDKSGQCAWKLGRLQAEEGPARACPENPGAALRERSSLSSQDFGKSGQCAWRPG